MDCHRQLTFDWALGSRLRGSNMKYEIRRCSRSGDLAATRALPAEHRENRQSR